MRGLIAVRFAALCGGDSAADWLSFSLPIGCAEARRMQRGSVVQGCGCGRMGASEGRLRGRGIYAACGVGSSRDTAPINGCCRGTLGYCRVTAENKADLRFRLLSSNLRLPQANLLKRKSSVGISPFFAGECTERGNRVKGLRVRCDERAKTARP